MDFSHFLQTQGNHTEPIGRIDFQVRLDILLKMKLSGVTEQI